MDIRRKTVYLAFASIRNTLDSQSNMYCLEKMLYFNYKEKQTNTKYRIEIIPAISIFIQQSISIRTILRKCRYNYIDLASKINFQQKLKNRKKEILLVSSGPFELVTNCTSI